MTDISRKSGKFFLLFGAATLLLMSCTESVAPIHQGTAIRIVEPQSIAELEDTFLRYRYDIKQLDSGVPPVIVESLPAEFSRINSAARKKNLFFQTLLPMVLLANQEIALERDDLLRINTLISNNQKIDSADLHLLATLQKRYFIKGEPTSGITLDRLLTRIDQVPAELALAQAANESAWGTSRFSQLGNNLFGEWTFTPGTGIIPEGRPEGATYEVKRFATLYDSIRSYLRNLNTHSAYADFRKLRSESRKRGEMLQGSMLAEGLLQYSTRREEYVRDLQNLIRQNDMQRFALANLRQG